MESNKLAFEDADEPESKTLENISSQKTVICKFCQAHFPEESFLEYQKKFLCKACWVRHNLDKKDILPYSKLNYYFKKALKTLTLKQIIMLCILGSVNLFLCFYLMVAGGGGPIAAFAIGILLQLTAVYAFLFGILAYRQSEMIIRHTLPTSSFDAPSGTDAGTYTVSCILIFIGHLIFLGTYFAPIFYLANNFFIEGNASLARYSIIFYASLAVAHIFYPAFLILWGQNSYKEAINPLALIRFIQEEKKAYTLLLFWSASFLYISDLLSSLLFGINDTLGFIVSTMLFPLIYILYTNLIAVYFSYLQNRPYALGEAPSPSKGPSKLEI